jgi:MFS family permease
MISTSSRGTQRINSSKSSDIRLLLATSLGHSFTHWFPSTFYLLLPLIKEELGLTYTEMGLLITTRYALGTIANIPSGMIVDILGKRNIIMAVALAWVGIPYLVIGLSENFTLILLLMAIIGAGGNLWHPAALSTLKDYYPKRRGWAIGWHSSAANIGDALGPLVSGILLAWISWRLILIGSALPGVILAILILWLLEEYIKSHTHQRENRDEKSRKTLYYGKGLINLLKNRNIFFLSLTSGIRSLTQNGLSTFLPSFFINLMLFSPWVAGIYMTLIQIAGIIAAPISGQLSDKHGRKQVVASGLLLTSFAISLLIIVNHQALFVVVLGVLGFFLYSLRPAIFAWTMETAPEEFSGSVVGVMFTFQSAFSSIAPIVGGWVADTWGLIYTFYFLAITVFLANIIVLFVPETFKK